MYLSLEVVEVQSVVINLESVLCIDVFGDDVCVVAMRLRRLAWAGFPISCVEKFCVWWE